MKTGVWALLQKKKSFPLFWAAPFKRLVTFQALLNLPTPGNCNLASIVGCVLQVTSLVNKFFKPSRNLVQARSILYHESKVYIVNVYYIKGKIYPKIKNKICFRFKELFYFQRTIVINKMNLSIWNNAYMWQEYDDQRLSLSTL